MPRPPRQKKPGANYHVWNRVAGWPGWHPFRDREAWRKLREVALRYIEAFCCGLAGFQILGNHYHLVVDFEAPRPLSRRQLLERARLLWGPEADRRTESWTETQWEAFRLELFDVSELMQYIDGEYAKWFNRRYGRRGHLWAGRFQSAILEGLEALQDCLLYVELNAVRAGLARRPEQWKAGSARWRVSGRDQRLIPLRELFPGEPEGQLLQAYRARLYHRGAVPSKEGQAAIPDWVLRQEQRRGFALPGAFRQRLPFFARGLAVGPRDWVLALGDHLHGLGFYARPREPFPQPGSLFSLVRPRPAPT